LSSLVYTRSKWSERGRRREGETGRKEGRE
jgi:hypothetical protein